MRHWTKMGEALIPKNGQTHSNNSSATECLLSVLLLALKGLG